jgi:uncharacterized protein (DUF2062 family)
MIHATRAAVRKWLDGLLHIHDSPRRTAAAFALGVFLGFSPFLGLHTILALAIAFLFNLNRVAVLLGVYSNLPWIMAPYYALTTAFGAELLGTRLPPGFREQIYSLFELSLLQSDFWRKLFEMLQPLLWAYAAGSIIGAVVLSTMAYRLALAFVVARRRHHHARH